VHLEASTKPHVHQKFEIFWTNIASTMACPNFKNGPKTGLRPLGVKTSCKFNFLVFFGELLDVIMWLTLGLKGRGPKNKFVLLKESWIFTFFQINFKTWFYMM
jgi:hypothetical protein